VQDEDPRLLGIDAQAVGGERAPEPLGLAGQPVAEAEHAQLGRRVAAGQDAVVDAEAALVRRLRPLQVVAAVGEALGGDNARRRAQDDEQGDAPMQVAEVEEQREQGDSPFQRVPGGHEHLVEALLQTAPDALHLVVVLGALQLLQRHRLGLAEALRLGVPLQELLEITREHIAEMVAAGVDDGEQRQRDGLTDGWREGRRSLERALGGVDQPP